MKEQMNKLAKLAHDGASMQVICDIFNVEQPQILELMELDVYKKALSEVSAEDYEKSQLLNKGWDGVEEFGISQVLDYMQTVVDPEYALKAVALANKAIRRGGSNQMNNGNAMIQVNNNLQAVIHVQPGFAKTLEENYMVEDVRETNFPKKITNALNPAKVKDLLRNAIDFKPVIADDVMKDLALDNFV